MLLQETCPVGQVMDRRSAEGMVLRQIHLEIMDGGTGCKNVFFIVYNFFEKCLNQSLAAAFRAPNRCGLLFN